jgi:lysylphosphatidylglycerol synthetase-like protein (DUF2156 family)
MAGINLYRRAMCHTIIKYAQNERNYLMKRKKIWWLRIFTNTLFGIITSLVAILVTNAFTDVKKLITVTLIVGGLQGLLAFVTELKKQVGEMEDEGMRSNNSKHILFLLF